MSIGERFAILLKEKGITQKAFSKKIGYREQSISNLITGQTKSPKADLITKIAQFFPDLNVRWLLLDEGEMFSQNDEINNSSILQENKTLQVENTRLREELIKAKDKIIDLLE